MLRPARNVAEEIGQNAAVGNLQAGPIVVEGPDDFDGDFMDLPEIDAQGFAVALGFVVATARAGATDVAAISLFGGDVGRVGVAVNLAGGKEQEALHRAGHCRVEQMAQADDVGVHGLDGMLAIKKGRGDGGGVDDEIHRVEGLLLHDVARLAEQVGARQDGLQPEGGAAGEIVPGQQAARFVGQAGIVQGQEIMDEVAAQKTGGAGEKNGFPGKALVERA